MTDLLTPAALLEHLRADGPRLLAAAERAGWDAPVPGTDWDVRTLVVHTGAVHRWSADIVRRSLATNETGGSAAFHPDLPDADLAAWFRQGHEALVDVLTTGDADAETFRFYRGGSGRDFWTRRQAHETAVHRADAQAAAGSTPAVAADLAQDGIAEMAIFAKGRAFTALLAERGALDGRSIALRATDGPSWRAHFGDRLELTPADDPAGDVTITGGSGELYLWLWNRPGAGVRIVGDADVAGRWRTVRIT